MNSYPLRSKRRTRKKLAGYVELVDLSIDSDDDDNNDFTDVACGGVIGGSRCRSESGVIGGSGGSERNEVTVELKRKHEANAFNDEKSNEKTTDKVACGKTQKVEARLISSTNSLALKSPTPMENNSSSIQSLQTFEKSAKEVNIPKGKLDKKSHLEAPITPQRRFIGVVEAASKNPNNPCKLLPDVTTSCVSYVKATSEAKELNKNSKQLPEESSAVKRETKKMAPRALHSNFKEVAHVSIASKASLGTQFNQVAQVTPWKKKIKLTENSNVLRAYPTTPKASTTTTAPSALTAPTTPLRHNTFAKSRNVPTVTPTSTKPTKLPATMSTPTAPKPSTKLATKLTAQQESSVQATPNSKPESRPDPIPSTPTPAFQPVQSIQFDQNDYQLLRQRYLTPRIRKNAQLANGMSLRKQCRGRVIDQWARQTRQIRGRSAKRGNARETGFQKLRKEIDRMDKELRKKEKEETKQKTGGWERGSGKRGRKRKCKVESSNDSNDGCDSGDDERSNPNDGHLEIYRVLCQLREWDLDPRKIPPMFLKEGFNNDDEVFELVDLTYDSDDDVKDCIDVDEADAAGEVDAAYAEKQTHCSINACMGSRAPDVPISQSSCTGYVNADTNVDVDGTVVGENFVHGKKDDNENDSSQKECGVAANGKAEKESYSPNSGCKHSEAPDVPISQSISIDDVKVDANIKNVVDGREDENDDNNNHSSQDGDVSLMDSTSPGLQISQSVLGGNSQDLHDERGFEMNSAIVVDILPTNSSLNSARTTADETGHGLLVNFSNRECDQPSQQHDEATNMDCTMKFSGSDICSDSLASKEKNKAFNEAILGDKLPSGSPVNDTVVTVVVAAAMDATVPDNLPAPGDAQRDQFAQQQSAENGFFTNSNSDDPDDVETVKERLASNHHCLMKGSQMKVDQIDGESSPPLADGIDTFCNNMDDRPVTMPEYDPVGLETTKESLARVHRNLTNASYVDFNKIVTEVTQPQIGRIGSACGNTDDKPAKLPESAFTECTVEIPGSNQCTDDLMGDENTKEMLIFDHQSLKKASSFDFKEAAVEVTQPQIDSIGFFCNDTDDKSAKEPESACTDCAGKIPCSNHYAHELIVEETTEESLVREHHNHRKSPDQVVTESPQLQINGTSSLFNSAIEPEQCICAHNLKEKAAVSAPRESEVQLLNLSIEPLSTSKDLKEATKLNVVSFNSSDLRSSSEMFGDGNEEDDISLFDSKEFENLENDQCIHPESSLHLLAREALSEQHQIFDDVQKILLTQGRESSPTKPNQTRVPFEERASTIIMRKEVSKNGNQSSESNPSNGVKQFSSGGKLSGKCRGIRWKSVSITGASNSASMPKVNDLFQTSDGAMEGGVPTTEASCQSKKGSGSQKKNSQEGGKQQKSKKLFSSSQDKASVQMDIRRHCTIKGNRTGAGKKLYGQRTSPAKMEGENSPQMPYDELDRWMLSDATGNSLGIDPNNAHAPEFTCNTFQPSSNLLLPAPDQRDASPNCPTKRLTSTMGKCFNPPKNSCLMFSEISLDEPENFSPTEHSGGGIPLKVSDKYHTIDTKADLFPFDNADQTLPAKIDPELATKELSSPDTTFTHVVNKTNCCDNVDIVEINKIQLREEENDKQKKRSKKLRATRVRSKSNVTTSTQRQIYEKSSISFVRDFSSMPELNARFQENISPRLSTLTSDKCLNTHGWIGCKMHSPRQLSLWRYGQHERNFELSGFINVTNPCKILPAQMEKVSQASSNAMQGVGKFSMIPSHRSAFSYPSQEALADAWREQSRRRRKGEWLPTGGWRPPKWAKQGRSEKLNDAISNEGTPICKHSHDDKIMTKQKKHFECKKSLLPTLESYVITFMSTLTTGTSSEGRHSQFVGSNGVKIDANLSTNQDLPPAKSLRDVICPHYFEPSMDALKSAHHMVESLLPMGDCENFEVVKIARRYYDHWRPAKGETRVIILAESHAFTEVDRALKGPGLDENLLKNRYFGPRQFLSLVYCLAYGENKALSPPLNDKYNKGTPQFWTLFAACSRGVDHMARVKEKSKAVSQFAADVLKGGGLSVEDRLEAKVEILEDLRSRGIWLLDVSIFGWYISQPQIFKQSSVTNEIHRKSKNRPPKDLKAPSLVLSWELFTKHVIREVSNEGNLKLLVPIGMEVEASITRERMEDAIATDPNARVTETFPAPNAWIPGGYGPFYAKLAALISEAAPRKNVETCRYTATL